MAVQAFERVLITAAGLTDCPAARQRDQCSRGRVRDVVRGFPCGQRGKREREEGIYDKSREHSAVQVQRTTGTETAIGAAISGTAAGLNLAESAD